MLCVCVLTEKELDDEEDHVDPHGDQYIQHLAMKVCIIVAHVCIVRMHAVLRVECVHTCTCTHTHTHTHMHTHTHARTHTQLGGGDSESDDSELPQTLIEIDYETAIDDEDVVDEFLVFKTTLHSECLSRYSSFIQLAVPFIIHMLPFHFLLATTRA